MKNFSAQNFEEIFTQIIEGKIKNNEIKNFLINLNNANLPSNAFIGAVAALRKKMKIIKAPKNAIDVCGTGGDKLNSLNISTAVCFVVAACDVVVAKHGNKAMSSKSGSADIFAELGIKISSDINEIENNLAKNKLCFLFAPFFHESLKNIAPIRKELAIATIFNFLGPLLNPANTDLQLIGSSRHDVMPKMLAARGDAKKIYMVHGQDGMDEISLCADSYLLKYENGQILEEEIINPEKFGFKKVKIDDIKGKDPKYNAQKLLELLDGHKSPYRDIVVLNSAFALKLANKVKNIEEGVEMAKEAIDSSKSKNLLKKLT